MTEPTVPLTPRMIAYLVLAAAGLSLTWWHNLAFAAETGSMSIGDFVAAVFVNHASSSIGWDICVGATAFLVFLVPEAKKLGMRAPYAYVALTFLVAFAFAAPLFLFFRERALARRASAA